jgi:HTH-type transcriptional regulator / antitoxin HipB
MPSKTNELPVGHLEGSEIAVRSAVELGAVVRAQRRRLALKQLDIAGLGNTGNRFIVDLEHGKPTVQLQKVLDIMDLLGLELVVRSKRGRSL